MNEQEFQKTAERLGQTLQKKFPLPLAKPSRLTIEKCPACGLDRPMGLFGACIICHRKNALAALPDKQRQLTYLYAVPPKFINASFNDLPGAVVSRLTALPEHTGLMLWGTTGAGKTHTMAALAKHFIDEGFTVERTTYEMLCLRIRDTFKTSGKESELGLIEPYISCDKLFIEDVGTSKSWGNLESDFSVRTLYVLLDYRLENLLPTFITTNKPAEELAKTFDSRIMSRIVEACQIIKLSGRDRRLPNKEKETK